MEHVDLETLKITVQGKEVDFTLARRLAEDLASATVSDPMLIAWFDGKKGIEHPQVPECPAQAWLDIICRGSWWQSSRGCQSK